MKQIALCFLAVLLLVPAVAAQSNGSGTLLLNGPCLWAGISANAPVFAADPHGNVVFTFALVNDCQEAVRVAPEEWKLVVNGEELKDSEEVFGADAALLPGGSNYRFMRTLSLSRYFMAPGLQGDLRSPTLAPGVYKVSWRGADFASPEITIRIVGKGKLLPAQ